MSNGNGTNSNGQPTDNPMWTWIRPTSVIMYGMVLGFLITAGIAILAFAERNWTMLSIVWVVCLLFLALAWGVRTLFKMLEAGINLTPSNPVNSKIVSPKADGGQSTAAAGDGSAVEPTKFRDDWGSSGGLPAPQPQPVNPNNIILQAGAMQFQLDVITGKETFDPSAFIADIRADSLANKDNETDIEITGAYDARSEIEGNAAPWKFTNILALKDAIKFVSGLYARAFAIKFGVSYQTAVQNFASTGNSGCSTCAKTKCSHPTFEEEVDYMGPDYARMLQEYRQLQFAANFIQ